MTRGKNEKMYIAKRTTVETYEEVVYVKVGDEATAREKFESGDGYVARRRHIGTTSTTVSDLTAVKDLGEGLEGWQ